MNNEIQPLQLFATSPKGLELLLVEELRSLGAINPKEKLAGVEFAGDLELAYKACLWSRFANRILLTLAKIKAATPEELYKGIQTISWDEHLNPNDTLSVHFVSSQSQITHTLFGAQKVKDAIVDQFRDRYGVRPSVVRDKPNVHVYIYLHRDEAIVCLDLSGTSLHKRGYRLTTGPAPLKENLAAAILTRANWQSIAKEKGTLLDPMCGTGTLLIEGALIAADIAPGLLRDYFGFLGWKKHPAHLWQTLKNDAQIRRDRGLLSLPIIVGYDHDAEAIKIAFVHIDNAGLHGKIHVEKRALCAFQPQPKMQPGLVIANPPYGERLGEVQELKKLYAGFGEKLKESFAGWHAAIFTGNPLLGKEMGIRATRYYALWNGAIACKLLLFSVQSEYFVDKSEGAENERRIRFAQRKIANEKSQSVEMFVNRVRKNLKHLKKQAKQQGQNTYRIYDADLPDYQFSIDMTEQGAIVKEYPYPPKANINKLLERRYHLLACLPELLELPEAQIWFEESFHSNE